MRFLTPAYLVGGVLIALPIILHWLRRDAAPRVPFTAVRLLPGSQIERSRRRRLRDILLLAARVTALLLLAGSFARPYLTGSAASIRPTIVAIDRSFSMSATGRMDRARELGRQAVAEAGDRVGVVAFDQRADVLAAIGNAADARAAIDRVQAGYAGTRYGALFDKVAELLTEEPHARLVVVTDMQRAGFDGGTPSLADGVELVVRDVGAPTGNLAVVDARADARRLVATVPNAGPAARDVDVRLESSGRTRATRRVAIDAGTSIEVPFDKPPQGGFDVAIDDPDGYAADNVRFGTNAPRLLPRVLIAGGAVGSGDGFYLSRALTAAEDEGPDVDVRIVPGADVVGMTASRLSEYAVVILLSTHGIDRRLREPLRAFVDAGGGLLIVAANEVDPSVLATVLDWLPHIKPHERAGRGVLAPTDVRHPIFKPFAAVVPNLGQVSFDRVWQLDATGDWQAVARFTDGAPALLEARAGRGRIVLFTSDLDKRWNDFPLHPIYVPFAQELVRYLGARQPPSAEMLVADVPAGSPGTPGLVQAGGRILAVNVDPRESTIDRVGPLEFTRSVSRTPADTRAAVSRAGALTEARQQYWHYGLILMLCVLIAEAFVGAKGA
jgi:Aerotolerance regulator N-terminal/von Willebrand factor type A domain